MNAQRELSHLPISQQPGFLTPFSHIVTADGAPECELQGQLLSHQLLSQIHKQQPDSASSNFVSHHIQSRIQLPALPPLLPRSTPDLLTPTRLFSEFLDVNFTPGILTRYAAGEANPFEKSFSNNSAASSSPGPVFSSEGENSLAGSGSSVTNSASKALYSRFSTDYNKLSSSGYQNGKYRISSKIPPMWRNSTHSAHLGRNDGMATSHISHQQAPHSRPSIPSDFVSWPNSAFRHSYASPAAEKDGRVSDIAKDWEQSGNKVNGRSQFPAISIESERWQSQAPYSGEVQLNNQQQQKQFQQYKPHLFQHQSLQERLQPPLTNTMASQPALSCNDGRDIKTHVYQSHFSLPRRDSNASSGDSIIIKSDSNILGQSHTTGLTSSSSSLAVHQRPSYSEGGKPGMMYSSMSISSDQLDTHSLHDMDLEDDDDNEDQDDVEVSVGGFKRRPRSKDIVVRRQRALERNRVAASKCRQKKKAWITALEKELMDKNIENRKLVNLVQQLAQKIDGLERALGSNSGALNCDVPPDSQPILHHLPPQTNMQQQHERETFEQVEHHYHRPQLPYRTKLESSWRDPRPETLQ